MNQIPASTQWTLDAAGDTGRSAVNSVFMIVCSQTGAKGSGFLIDNGLIVTNEHVVRGCSRRQITAVSAYGEHLQISKTLTDSNRDLAILIPKVPLSGGLKLSATNDLQVGEPVTTWGHPLGYNGPTPLLSVGYLAGFISHQAGTATKKHLVVNGAFNSGNSGGALFRASDNKVIGIVASKHAPISKQHQQAIDTLAKNETGVCFKWTDGNGHSRTIVESQIVADLLTHFRSLTQVVIGEAIAVEELIAMINEHGLSNRDIAQSNSCIPFN